MKLMIENLEVSNAKIVKENIELKQESDKLRARILNLRKKKNVGSSSVNSKFCKNCQREYTES